MISGSDARSRGRADADLAMIIITAAMLCLDWTERSFHT